MSSTECDVQQAAVYASWQAQTHVEESVEKVRPAEQAKFHTMSADTEGLRVPASTQESEQVQRSPALCCT